MSERVPLGSSQLVWCFLDIEDGAHILLPLALVLDHPVVDTGVLSLDVERRLGRQRVEHKVVVAVRAVLVAAPLVLADIPWTTTSVLAQAVPVLELAGVFAEGLLALFAYEDHLKALQQRVVGRLLVAHGAVEPFLAARRADRDLGVEDVFTAGASAGEGGVAGRRGGGESKSARRTTCWRRWGAAGLVAGLVAAGRCCCRRASSVWCPAERLGNVDGRPTS